MNRVALSKITGRMPPRKLLNSPEPSLRIPDCRIGIEIEWEGITMDRAIRHVRPDINPYWSVKPDGSLRNNGIELVLQEPLFGVDLLKAVQAVDGMADQLNPSISPRCSVHVHLDVRDMELKSLYRLLFLYLMFERTIVKYHGGEREKNIFCLPYYIAPGSLSQLGMVLGLSFDDEEDSHRAADILQTSCEKYSAFNMQALFNFGSIEFRHMGGADDTKSILEWVNLVLGLKQLANQLDFDPKDFLLWYKSRDVLRLAKTLFDTQAMSDTEMLKDFRLGTNLIREILVRPHFKKRRSPKVSNTARQFLKSKGIS